MRLIDADALQRHGGRKGLVFSRDIDNAPTIDPFKDKSLEQLMDECFNRGYQHGRWDWQGVGVFCSECHYKLQTTGLPSYCPNCGAKMDGGKESEVEE